MRGLLRLLLCLRGHHEWSPMTPEGSPRWCVRCGLCPASREEEGG